MIKVKLLCVGKLKEKYLLSAQEEYTKRLSSLCKLEIEEIPESRLPDDPGSAEIEIALKKEAEVILEKIPKNSYTVAMCIEGQQLDSVQLADKISSLAVSGSGSLCYIIGGSYGIYESVKKEADMRLSMSKMTFPHHLARIMLLEQIYRSFKINEGSRYHK